MFRYSAYSHYSKVLDWQQFTENLRMCCNAHRHVNYRAFYLTPFYHTVVPKTAVVLKFHYVVKFETDTCPTHCYHAHV